MEALPLTPFPAPVNVFAHLADQLQRADPPLPADDPNVVWLRWLAQHDVTHWDPVFVLALGRIAVSEEARALMKRTIAIIEAEIAAGSEG